MFYKNYEQDFNTTEDTTPTNNNESQAHNFYREILKLERDIRELQNKDTAIIETLSAKIDTLEAKVDSLITLRSIEDELTQYQLQQNEYLVRERIDTQLMG